ncbi:hypothetical protein BU15DRAFT_77148 [Melanogaster broomeanus]|nr:hypothetical protein BU15DRAFT_77148 [Melanogaster broomeanus]
MAWDEDAMKDPSTDKGGDRRRGPTMTTTWPLPSGSLFPIAVPTDDDLACLWEFELTVFNVGGIPGIYTVPERQLYTKVPKHYVNLVRRFIWRRLRRREVFKTLLNKQISRTLDEEIQDTLRRNALYLENVLRYIQKPLEAEANANPPGRIRLFDIYMLEDYFVGRHDPAAVIIWQRGHEQNLRTTDILSPDIGKKHVNDLEQSGRAPQPHWQPQPHCHCHCRSCYHWNIGKIDPDGKGKLVEDCKLLFGDFYDHPYARMEVVDEGEAPCRVYGGDVLAEF